jgi:hypothetical protein
MNQPPLIKIQQTTAGEICAHFDLSDKSKPLLRDAMQPGEFVAVLIDNKHYLDGIDFIAHALPVRDGLWWGCLCMQHALGDDLNPEDRAAATAAVHWLLEPSEQNRTAAKLAATATDRMSPAGTLAMAVGLTGGSMYPPVLPFKAPAPFAPQGAVARAVKLASLKCPPAPVSKTQRSFVELAIQVAEGHLI